MTLAAPNAPSEATSAALPNTTAVTSVPSAVAIFLATETASRETAFSEPALDSQRTRRDMEDKLET